MSIVVLASGGGSNFQALLDDPVIRPNLSALICNRPGAGCLDKAMAAGIEHAVIDHTDYDGRADFEQALIGMIDRFQPSLLVLAGFMRILETPFVSHYAGRMLNIHPSLLPRYKGLNTHQRAIDAGDSEAGVSVHLVTAELDGGPIIGQRRVPVLAGDTASTLAGRVLTQEHELYPAVIRAVLDQRLNLTGAIPTFEGQPLNQPLAF